jgi:hypothetical protein
MLILWNKIIEIDLLTFMLLASILLFVTGCGVFLAAQFLFGGEVIKTKMATKIGETK